MQPHILDTHNISDRPSQNPHVYGILYQYNLDTPEKALRYFESTSFNDPQSQNFYLNLQTSDRDPDIYTFDSYLLDLENTIGYRYIVDEKSSRLPLWIIHKQLKLKPTDSWELVGVYSILNGIVWQAPNIHDLVQSRLLDSITLLQSSLSNITSHLPRASNRLQEHWTSLPAEVVGAASGSGSGLGVGADGIKPLVDEEKESGSNLNVVETVKEDDQSQTPSTSAITNTQIEQSATTTTTTTDKSKRTKRKRNILPDAPNFALQTALSLGKQMRLDMISNRWNDGDTGVGVGKGEEDKLRWGMTKEEEEAEELMNGGTGKRRSTMIITR